MYIDPDFDNLSTNASCPICGGDAYSHSENAILIVCKICGKYRFDIFARAYLSAIAKDRKSDVYKISSELRSISERARGKRDNSFFPTLSSEDFDRMLDLADPSVPEKLRLLFTYVTGLTQFPGEKRVFDNSNDYPIVCAKNAEESQFYMRGLEEQGFLELDPPRTTSLSPKFTITTRGWQEIDRLAREVIDSKNAFIAMWFDASRAPFEKAINRAIENAGYLPVRIDRIEHVNRIDDEIIARIRQSKFLISDFTGQRNGVYFEAGFMLGLGRPVIWICEQSDLKNLHFDTRQYSTINYTNPLDLETRLQFRIEAVLGKGK
jgi:nucleoside 2-deoxyribosyltransferase